MLSLGLESKEGTLRTLGEEFPAEKLHEIRQELLDDAKADGGGTKIKISSLGKYLVGCFIPISFTSNRVSSRSPLHHSYLFSSRRNLLRSPHRYLKWCKVSRIKVPKIL